MIIYCTRLRVVLESLVLRVFINISKIPYLRAVLLFSLFINVCSIYIFIIHCRRLLGSQNLRVSYCASEIIAHLAFEPSWETYSLRNKAKILKELQCAVERWHRCIQPKKLFLHIDLSSIFWNYLI